MAKDISAIKYLANSSLDETTRKMLVESVKYLADKCDIELSDPDKLKKSISELEAEYSDTSISDKIQEFDIVEAYTMVEVPR